MAPHSSTLAWKTPWTEEPGRLQLMGHKELDTTEWLYLDFQWLPLHMPFSISVGGLVTMLGYHSYDSVTL